MRLWIKRLLIVGVILAVISLVGTGVLVNITSKHQFCNSCHIMEPYYQSWEKGKHKGVECVSCHMPPDLEGKLITKFQALSQVAKYVTRTYGTRPWGHIANASCLVSGCHSLDKLSNHKVPFRKGVFFAHAPHFKAKVRTAELLCSTCHTQIDRGTHMEIATQSCFTCHFKGGDERDPKMSSCTKCHSNGMPQNAMAASALAHTQLAVKAGASDANCKSCHREVIRGDGAVPSERCKVCHNSSKIESARTDIPRIHEIHVHKAGAKCLDCHTEIRHKRQQKPTAAAARRAADDCSSCHGSEHSPQRDMYRGTYLPDGKPSTMYTAGVGCADCHTVAPVPGGKLKLGSPIEKCSTCHGDKIGSLVTRFKNAMENSMAILAGNLKTISDAAGPAPSAPVKDRLARIQQDLARLKEARGVHNMPLARKVLDGIADNLAATMALAGKPLTLQPLPQDLWVSTSCLSCHFGIDDGPVPQKHGAFSHATHREVIAEKKCDTCHTAQKSHGSIDSPQSCNACHHDGKKERKKCEMCHVAEGAVFKGSLASLGLEVKSKMPDNKGCAECHVGLKKGHDVKKLQASCEDCHKEGPKVPTLTELQSKFDLSLKSLKERAAKATLPADAKARVDALIGALENDRSRGVHNPPLDTAVQAEVERLIH